MRISDWSSDVCSSDLGDAAGVRIDPALVQSLGLRTAEAHRGTLGSGLTVTGTIGYNQRDIAIVQPRASGFVQRTYNRAPDDVIGAGAPLVDLLIPEDRKSTRLNSSH